MWKCLIMNVSENVLYEDEQVQKNLAEKLKSLTVEPRDNSRFRIVLIASGGHFAGCIFDGETVVAHKTFHRLVSQGCRLVGCSSVVPALQISNDELLKIVDTNDEWISVRTGIRRRHVISGGDSLIILAADAAKKALEMAKVDLDDIDLILMCTSTPEDLFGSDSQIQKQLGCMKNPLSYDITAACSGFVLGLLSAACHIRGGGFRNVLVIGADALSRYVDWTDRGTCILFGDVVR